MALHPDIILTMANKKAYVLFRVDSSPIIGYGHVSRCLTLANKMRELDYTCIFVCRSFFHSQINDILHNGYEVVSLEALTEPQPEDKTCLSWLGDDTGRDAYEFSRIVESLGKNNIYRIIIDHYAIDTHWEQTIGLPHKLVVIDDLANRPHICSLLIDQNYGKQKEDYIALVAKWTKLLIGSRYCLLRPEFSKKYHRKVNKKPIVLIVMGGTDPHNMSLYVIDALKSLADDITIKILIGPKCPHIPLLKVETAKANNITLEIDCKNIAQLFSVSTLSIGAVGGSIWERFSMGLPSICITTAQNQINAAHKLHDDGLIDYLGHHNSVHKTQILASVQRFLSGNSRLQGKDISTVCDGLGTERVIKSILNTKVSPSMDFYAEQNGTN